MAIRSTHKYDSLTTPAATTPVKHLVFVHEEIFLATSNITSDGLQRSKRIYELPRLLGSVSSRHRPQYSCAYGSGGHRIWGPSPSPGASSTGSHPGPQAVWVHHNLAALPSLCCMVRLRGFEQVRLESADAASKECHPLSKQTRTKEREWMKKNPNLNLGPA